jgi:hypothetical protein
MPSGEIEYFPLSDIEPSLRRECTESKVRKVEVLFWIIILGALLATTLHFVVEPRLFPTPVAQAASNQQELCNRYLVDSSLNGTAAKQTLLTICN